jgi:2-keto-3-deoxy-L-rhamnonate aldolase RhmA
MQHSALTWADIEKMIATCPHVAATPMVRMQHELESSIQHATDIGVLGITMPTVDTVEKAEDTVRYARYPPEGRRSIGGCPKPQSADDPLGLSKLGPRFASAHPTASR